MPQQAKKNLRKIGIARNFPPPARKKKRAARAAPPAVPAPRPPAERPAPPRGDRIPGRGFEGTAAPSRVNFRKIRDPGYRPKNQKTPEKIRRKKEKQLPMRTDASNG